MEAEPAIRGAGACRPANRQVGLRVLRRVVRESNTEAPAPRRALQLLGEPLSDMAPIGVTRSGVWFSSHG